MNRTRPVRARREPLDIRESGCAVLPMSRTSEVRAQGFSLPLGPNFGTNALPHLQRVGLTESRTAGEPNNATPEGRTS